MVPTAMLHLDRGLNPFTGSSARFGITLGRIFVVASNKSSWRECYTVSIQGADGTNMMLWFLLIGMSDVVCCLLTQNNLSPQTECSCNLTRRKKATPALFPFRFIFFCLFLSYVLE